MRKPKPRNSPTAAAARTPMHAAGAAIAAAVAAAAVAFYARTRSPAFLTLNFGVDVVSLDELLQLSEPALIVGLEPELHLQLAEAWTPDALRRSALGSAELELRLTRGANRTRVMRYSTRHGAFRTTAGGPFVDTQRGIEWRRHLYDSWDMKRGQTVVGGVLDPPQGTSAGFSTDMDSSALGAVHPPGVQAAQRLEHAVCLRWADHRGCAEELEMGRLIWLASKGLGQQLHHDLFSNLFFHLSGSKEVLLVPPEAMVDSAHLLPATHPAARQSQLAWTSETSSRLPSGFSAPAADDDPSLPPPAYDTSVERRVSLRPGELLFIPSHWGHQTFTGAEGPSASFALWFFPSVSPRGANPPPKELRGRAYEVAKVTAVNDVLDPLEEGASGAAWAGLRELGASIADELVGSAEKGAALRQNWAAQRWQPQFGGLGADASSRLPSVLCQPAAPADRERAAYAALKLVFHVRELATWYPRASEAAVLRAEAMDLLDWTVGLLEQLQPLVQAMEEEGATSRGAMLVWLVRSMSGECAAHDS